MQQPGSRVLREHARWLDRHKPFVVVVLGFVLVAAFLPGEVREETVVEGTVAGGPSAATDVERGDGETAADRDRATQARDTDAAGTRQATAEDPAAAEERTAADGQPAAPAEARTLDDPLEAPDCDPETGRLKVPSFSLIYAPNCVPMWPDGADNGGETYRGVTGDTITIAIYMGEPDEQQSAMVQAAGVDDGDEEERHENRNKVIEAYEAHFETYGRQVEWVEVEASGPPEDDAAARSDAIRVAEEIGAFASISSPAMDGGGNTYVDELAHRGVLCAQCIPTQAHWNFQEWAPHVWNLVMTASGRYIHLAELLGKRVGDGPAEYAGDPTMQLEDRRFGHIMYNTPDGAYDGMDAFFDEELARYGLAVSDRVEYVLDIPRAQEQARTIISRMQDRGVTSIVCTCDPLTPAFFTNEATRQQYFPEWVIGGGTYLHLTMFGRTYDELQWENAYGMSQFATPLNPDAQEEEDNIASWHHGEELDSYPNLVSLGLLYTGFHLAGPNLNPETFREGMFSLLESSGFKTRDAVSFGPGVWPWPDYNANDDARLIWWDPDATGTDELGAYGRGMMRYAEMGQSYMPGEHPDTPAPFFESEDTVTEYDERPEEDRLPTYERREPMRRP